MVDHERASDGAVIGPDLHTGIVNMLRHCAGLDAGQSLLILTEPSGADHYDPGLAPAVATVARAIGLDVTLQELPHCRHASVPASETMRAIATADRALFLTRRGDQLRFDPVLAPAAPVMCYALDRGMMASGFGQADHRGLVALLTCLNTALARAGRIHVTCPLGTDFHGPGARFPETGGEVSVRRFPLSVFSPVPAGDYAGRVAIAGFLTGTGKSSYDPYDHPQGSYGIS
jgi:hypothetical protein